jgi:nitrite reductase/ring-hydroxylating ferredoxin subunit
VGPGTVSAQPTEHEAKYFVISLSDLAPGERFVTEAGGSSIIVDRLHNGEVVAWWNHCPHRGSEMVSLGRARAGEVRCRLHRWRFDAQTGACIDQGVPGAWSPLVGDHLLAAPLIIDKEQLWVMGSPPV